MEKNKYYYKYQDLIDQIESTHEKLDGLNKILDDECYDEMRSLVENNDINELQKFTFAMPSCSYIKFKCYVGLEEIKEKLGENNGNTD